MPPALAAPGAVTLAITFVYYRDLPAAEAFWRDVMGLERIIDQGKVSKIFRLTEGAAIGLVDEAHGMNDWQADKCVQICLRVADVDAWRAYCQGFGATNLSEMFENEALGIRAFVFDDPEGYQVEIQTPTRAGA
jgi:predicted enzyme related to lactoylglutathione lyase